ncbi:DUF6056 family protein [Methanobrevibacter sp.]
MNIDKDKFELSQFIKDHYPIIGFFLLMVALHLIMGFLGDDEGYSKLLSDYPLTRLIVDRYNEWSSRVIIDALTIILSREFIIWKILDTILYTLGVYLLIKFINKDNNRNITLFGVLLFLMYPLFDMAGAGWVSTTLNYSWCFAFAMISFIPLVNELRGKKTNIIIYVLAILSLIYAVNQEQSCLMILGINVLYLIHCLINKRNISRFNILIVIVSAISLTMILTCPGNAERTVIETGRYYAEYANFGIVEKLYLGTIPTIEILLKDKVLFTVFYVLLSGCALLKTENKYLRGILYFNIILILFLVLFKTLVDISSINTYLNIGLIHKPVVASLLSAAKSVTESVPLVNDAIGLFGYKGIPKTLTAPAVLTVLISIYLILSSCWMIFKTFGKKQLLPLVLFAAGFLSRFAVGFSPTIFESGSRTAFFFYMTIIAVVLMLIRKLYDENSISDVWEKRMKIAFAALGLLTYFAVFAIVCVMF